MITSPALQRFRTLIALPAVALVAGACEGPAAPARYPIVPWPEEIKARAGEFLLDRGTPLVLSDPADEQLRRVAQYGAGLFESLLGDALSIVASPTDSAARFIELSLDPQSGMASEGYVLRIGPDRIVMTAATEAGLFYGFHTLRQLAPPGAAVAPLAIPAVEIRDAPRFPYRGMHLDVGRHFFPVAFVKRYIDMLASYKMNRFHWHLTEDQGWRIEIKKYPRLTQISSWRKETILGKNFDPYIGDGVPYGGYYTQSDIREIVAYAAARHVTVIPEIEMPGHSVAVLAAYPELACTDGPFEVATTWGVHEDIYCPRDATFAFLQDVLTEVMDLFPSRYIHIGGDEAPKARWERSPLAQEVIQREGLADEHELQSYFIGRVERFLLDNGRRLIGWDEILEGGLAPEATVMSWRGMDGGVEAARLGHDVIMTPTSHVYFDYYQGAPESEPLAIGGFTPLAKVYEFEPVPPELTEEEAGHVLGAQANLWTEYIRTPAHAEYMTYPRMLALSEVVWSPARTRNWSSFTNRLSWHFRSMDARGIAYRVSHVRGLEADRLTLGESVTIALSTLDPGATIRYTIDGTDPNPTSPAYVNPLILPAYLTGTTVTARAFLANGRSSPAAFARFAQAMVVPAETLNPKGLAPGLAYTYHEGAFRSVADLSQAETHDTGILTDIEIPEMARDTAFGIRAAGYMRVPRTGVYTFVLTSDDGSRLTVGGKTVIDHDGYHGPREQSGQIALEAGVHSMVVSYFQAGGGKALQLTAVWRGEPLHLGGRFLH